MPDAIIKFKAVSKSFGKLRVLDKLSLDFARGKTTVIIGPSGTGKSVLLKHIVGLLAPDSGEVWFEGKRVDHLSESLWVPVRTKIGFLFQQGALFDSMNVEQNICFPLQAHTTTTPGQRCDQCARVLKMVGLDGTQKKMPADLSGGQKKRVALARAIVLEPEVVLYDEPTTGLDPIRAAVINELIVSLSQQLKITSIVVTHDMHSADRIGDRMVMLTDGKIVADGDPEAFHRSTLDIVQRFIRGEADAHELSAIRAGFEPTEGR